MDFKSLRDALQESTFLNKAKSSIENALEFIMLPEIGPVNYIYFQTTLHKAWAVEM